MQPSLETAQRADSAYEAALAPANVREAVIIGGGVAGLLAAHVACQHGFHRVTLLDRDLLGGKVEYETVHETAARRPGVPQLCHPHCLLMGGIKAFDKLLPGITKQLLDAGGTMLDLSQDCYNFDFGMDTGAARGPTDYKFICMSRRLLEQTLRERVVADNQGKLVIRGGARVAGLTWSKDGSSVTGVQLATGDTLAATLVIDASGRHSQLPLWLEEGKWGRPAVKKVDAQLCYTSRTVQLPEQPVHMKGDPQPSTGPEDRAGGCKHRGQSVVFELGRPGQRGGVVGPIEGNRAIVLLYGYGGDKPPMDEEGFMQYAAAFPTPDKAVYRVLSASKPVSPIIRYAGLKTALRCYHEMAMPLGLLVVGDSVMELDPLLGQGMTVAAIGSLVLAAALGEAFPACTSGAAGKAQHSMTHSEALRQLAGSFQKKWFEAVSVAWDIHCAEDMRYPTAKVEGVSRPPRIVSYYFDLLQKAGLRDRLVRAEMYKVVSMVKPPSALFGPAMAWSAAKEAAREAWALATGLVTRA
ncbi:hypothetical protein N2152v2_000153 [Parachlorella kessleri]